MVDRIHEVTKLGRDTMQPVRDLREALGNLEQVKEQFDALQDNPTGTLTVRSSDTAGQITLGTGHGITTGQTFNLYFSGGVRSFCIAGTVDGNNIPFSGGDGDVLPVQDASVTAVHYKTLAGEVRAVNPSGVVDANVAHRIVNRVASTIAVTQQAIRDIAVGLFNYSP